MRRINILEGADGIHDYLNTDEMEEILAGSDGDWASALRNLVARAKAKNSPDDCSAVIIDCDPTLIAPNLASLVPAAVRASESGFGDISGECQQSNSESVMKEKDKPTKHKLWNIFKKTEKGDK